MLFPLTYSCEVFNIEQITFLQTGIGEWNIELTLSQSHSSRSFLKNDCDSWCNEIGHGSGAYYD